MPPARYRAWVRFFRSSRSFLFPVVRSHGLRRGLHSFAASRPLGRGRDSEVRAVQEACAAVSVATLKSPRLGLAIHDNFCDAFGGVAVPQRYPGWARWL